MWRGKKALCFFWVLTILIAVLWDAYPVDLYAAGKGRSMSQEEKSDEIRAYEDFLEQITKVLCWEDRLISVEYAYLDLGNDGKLELAVRFCGHIPIDDGREAVVLTIFLLEKNLLITQENHVLFMRLSYDWSDISKSKLGKQVFDEEETWSCTKSYNIQEKRYHIIELESEDVDADQWEEFCNLYEQKYDTLYTEEEIEQLIQKRRDDIGIKDAWLAKKELDWQLLENEKYREYVKEIDLIEARKEQHAESKSVLKDKWIVCKSEKYAMTSTINNDCFDVDSSWNNAIEYCLSDYCEKNGIPKGEWTLQRIISYGDGIFAVALSNDQLEVKRALCLLINSDALKAGLEE